MTNTHSELQDVFQNTRIHDTWESMYRNNPRLERFNDRMMDRFLGLMDLPHGARVLDAGCGTGEHTIRLAKRGYQCTGVDLSEPALERARRAAGEHQVTAHVRFVACGLEDLSPLDEGFDAVHCRGVLMHIPRWEDALGQLCKVLRPGGKIVIMENNHRSVEFGLVRLVRLFRRGESHLVWTPGGVEFHLENSGQAPLTRVANIPYLIAALRKHRVAVIARVATEFWDIGRFPAGMARTAAITCNRLWFSLRLPAILSCGNAIVGEKTSQSQVFSQTRKGDAAT